MSETLIRLYSEPTITKARHVGYSVRMVAEIAAHYDDAVDTGDFRLARCMLDAFYVHVRLLADFLLRTPRGEDFAPGDFGVSWNPPTGPGAQRLTAAWDIASKHVVHFGGRRVPTGPGNPSEFRVDGAHFRQLAEDAVTVFSTFVDEVAKVTPPWTRGTGALIPNRERDPKGWQARARAEALRELRTALSGAQADLEG